MPRAVASGSAATSSVSPKVGDGLQQVLVRGEPAAHAQNIYGVGGVDRLQGISDLVCNPATRRRGEIGGSRRLVAPTTVMRSAPCQRGVPSPAGAGTTTGC